MITKILYFGVLFCLAFLMANNLGKFAVKKQTFKGLRSEILTIKGLKKKLDGLKNLYGYSEKFIVDLLNNRYDNTEKGKQVQRVKLFLKQQLGKNAKIPYFDLVKISKYSKFSYLDKLTKQIYEKELETYSYSKLIAQALTLRKKTKITAKKPIFADIEKKALKKLNQYYVKHIDFKRKMVKQPISLTNYLNWIRDNKKIKGTRFLSLLFETSKFDLKKYDNLLDEINSGKIYYEIPNHYRSIHRSSIQTNYIEYDKPFLQSNGFNLKQNNKKVYLDLSLPKTIYGSRTDKLTKEKKEFFEYSYDPKLLNAFNSTDIRRKELKQKIISLEKSIFSNQTKRMRLRKSLKVEIDIHSKACETCTNFKFCRYCTDSNYKVKGKRLVDIVDKDIERSIRVLEIKNKQKNKQIKTINQQLLAIEKKLIVESTTLTLNNGKMVNPYSKKENKVYKFDSIYHNLVKDYIPIIKITDKQKDLMGLRKGIYQDIELVDQRYNLIRKGLISNISKISTQHKRLGKLIKQYRSMDNSFFSIIETYKKDIHKLSVKIRKLNKRLPTPNELKFAKSGNKDNYYKSFGNLLNFIQNRELRSTTQIMKKQITNKWVPNISYERYVNKMKNAYSNAPNIFDLCQIKPTVKNNTMKVSLSYIELIKYVKNEVIDMIDNTGKDENPIELKILLSNINVIMIRMRNNDVKLFQFRSIWKRALNLGILEYNLKLHVLKGYKAYKKSKFGYSINPNTKTQQIKYMIDKLDKLYYKKSYYEEFFSLEKKSDLIKYEILIDKKNNNQITPKEMISLNILLKKVKSYYVIAFPRFFKDFKKVKKIKPKTKEDIALEERIELESKLSIKIPNYVWFNSESIRDKYQYYKVLLIPIFLVENSNQLDRLNELKVKEIEAKILNQSDLTKDLIQSKIWLNEICRSNGNLEDQRYAYNYVANYENRVREEYLRKHYSDYGKIDYPNIMSQYLKGIWRVSKVNPNLSL